MIFNKDILHPEQKEGELYFGEFPKETALERLEKNYLKAIKHFRIGKVAYSPETGFSTKIKGYVPVFISEEGKAKLYPKREKILLMDEEPVKTPEEIAEESLNKPTKERKITVKRKVGSSGKKEKKGKKKK
jgi:hypothetical protein